VNPTVKDGAEERVDEDDPSEDDDSTVDGAL